MPHDIRVRPTLLIVTHGFAFSRSAAADEWQRNAERIAEELQSRGSATITWQIDWDAMAGAGKPTAELRQKIGQFLDEANQDWDILFVGHGRGAIVNNGALDDLAHPRLGQIGEIALDPTAATLLDDRYPQATDAVLSSLYHDGYDLLTTMGGLEIGNSRYVDLHAEMKADPSQLAEYNAQIADYLFDKFESGYGKLFARVGQAEADSWIYHAAVDDFYLSHGAYLDSDIEAFVATKPQLSTEQISALLKSGYDATSPNIERVTLADGSSPQLRFENAILAAINGMTHDRDNNLQVAEWGINYLADKIGEVSKYVHIVELFKSEFRRLGEQYLQAARSTNLEMAAAAQAWLGQDVLPLARMLDQAAAHQIDWRAVAAEMVNLLARWNGQDSQQWLIDRVNAAKHAGIDVAQEQRERLLDEIASFQQRFEAERRQLEQELINEGLTINDRANRARSEIESRLNREVDRLNQELNNVVEAWRNWAKDEARDARQEAKADHKRWKNWLRNSVGGIEDDFDARRAELERWLDRRIKDLPKPLRKLARHVNPLRHQFNQAVDSARRAADRAIDKAEARASREHDKIDRWLDRALDKIDNRRDKEIDAANHRISSAIAEARNSANRQFAEIASRAIEEGLRAQARIDAKISDLANTAAENMKRFNTELQHIEDRIQSLDRQAVSKIGEFAEIAQYRELRTIGASLNESMKSLMQDIAVNDRAQMATSAGELMAALKANLLTSQSGGALGQMGAGAANLAKGLATILQTKADGLAATEAEPIEQLAGALIAASNGDWVGARDNLTTGALASVLNNPQTQIGSNLGLILDVLGELRGEWSGRSLNVRERDLLRSVFGNDVRLDEIKIVQDAAALNSRPYVNGTTIFVPGNEPLEDAELIHEATHIVQKQAYHYDVTGRGVADQAGNELGVESYDLPQIQDGDTNLTVLHREGAESHATGVEAFFKVVIRSQSTTREAVQDFLAQAGNEQWKEYAEVFKDAGWFSTWL